jgi:hypothetical protein
MRRLQVARPLIATVLLGLACRAPDLADLELANGRSLQGLLAGRDSVTLLLLDPADCVTCDRRVAGWLEQRRRAPKRVTLVLLREPDPGESPRFRIRGLQPDGILGPSARYANLPHPAEFLFVRGQAVRPPG